MISFDLSAEYLEYEMQQNTKDMNAIVKNVHIKHIYEKKAL